MSTITRHVLMISIGCAFLLTAGSAWAQQSCQVDADCPGGQSCVRAPCAAPACDPDDDPACEPLPCSSVGICEDTFSSSCSQDADCREGFVCVTFSEEVCQASAVSCVPGEPCPEPDPPSCEEFTVSFCAPPYIAPCTQDSDCGEGFLCKPEQMCSCSGGGAVPRDPSDPSEPDSGAGDEAESECSCEPTGQNYCEAEQWPCETAAECPEEWSCESTANVAVPCSFDPQTGVSECLPPVESESYCVPPQWDVWGTSGGSYDDAVERAQSGATPTAPLTVQDSGGCAISATAGQGTGGLMLLLLLGLVWGIRRRARR